MIFQWDGLECLTVVGEPHFVVHCWTRLTLAGALLMMAFPDDPIDDELVCLFAAELLAAIDDRPFTLPLEAIQEWRTARVAA